MKRSYGLTLLISVIVTALFMFLMFRDMTLLAFVNAVSMTSLLLLIAGAFLYIFEGGFFNGIAYSFKRFYKKTFKAGEVLEDIEGDDDNYRPKSYSFSLTGPFLVIGAVLFLLTLGLSLLIQPSIQY